MFLPTPKCAIASSLEKMDPPSAALSSALTASKAFFSHPYRRGKVSWPDSCGVVVFRIERASTHSGSAWTNRPVARIARRSHIVQATDQFWHRR